MEAFDYREHVPPPELASSVRCLWELSAPPGGEAQLIVPDGCMELVMQLGDPLESIEEWGVELQPQVLWVGEARTPVTTRATGRLHMLGVRFAPGAGRRFLDAQVGEVIDAAPAAEDVTSLAFRRAVSTVLSAEPGDRIPLLVAALLRERAPPTGEDELVRRAMRLLDRAQGCIEIDAIALRLGVTRRHLERCFGVAAGAPPKSFAQVFRFRRVLRAIEDVEPDWGGIAVDCGYSDQSHLIRDFKRYTGLTPRTFLRGDHPLTTLFDGTEGRISPIAEAAK